MLSAYEFYKPQKGKRTVESDIELKSTIEMLAEVSKRIKLEQPSDILISSSPTKSKKLESASKRRRKHEALKLNKTRKRIHSPEKNNTKRSRMSNASTKGEGCIKIEIESVPDLVEEPVIEEEVINSLDLGGHLFDFLISPISMTDFAKEYYGLKPCHSVGGEKRCNLNLFLPIQKLDILVTTKRLYFGKDIELINGSSNFTGRAYRPKIWSEFANGATVRFLLPERYFSKFGVEMGLLQEIINGPIYSVVNFVSTSFSGSLVDFKSPNCPPGDVFIIVLENDLTVKVTSPQSTVGNGNVKIESAEMSFKMRAGDLLYLPSFYSHEVKLEEGCEHAIVLCIVNRTPVLIREWGTKLMRTMNMPQALIQTDLFRRLLECTRNSEAHFSDLYIDLNQPGKIFDGVSTWLIGQDVKFTKKDRRVVSRAIIELQKEFMRKSPSLQLHFSERNYHITTHGSYWQDPNFESGHEDEETVGVLQEGPNRPRLEGYPNFDDWELDLRSSVRIARRSAVCVVDDPNDPHHISLYHTFQNSMDARDDNELSSLKLPHDDVNLSMVKRLIDYYPQSVIINELARESEEEKTNLVHELFDNGVIIVTSLWQQHLFGENEEESVEMEEEDEESDSNQSIDFGEEYGSPGVEKVDLDEDDDSTADINDL